MNENPTKIQTLIFEVDKSLSLTKDLYESKQREVYIENISPLMNLMKFCGVHRAEFEKSTYKKFASQKQNFYDCYVLLKKLLWSIDEGDHKFESCYNLVVLWQFVIQYFFYD